MARHTHMASKFFGASPRHSGGTHVVASIAAACAISIGGFAEAAWAGPEHQHERAQDAQRRTTQIRDVKEIKRGFGPWGAGTKHEVRRQGELGLPRVENPPLGNPGKVPGDGPAPPSLRVDPDVPETAIGSANQMGGKQGLSSNPLYFASLVYSQMLTRLDGPRCAHYPTCSRFASQAVARHGALGILMGLDRLIRPTESSALRTLPEIEGFEVVRHLDPVSNYEFWNEERFTGLALAAEEQPLELADVKENAKQTGDAVLPPPARRQWTTTTSNRANPRPAPSVGAALDTPPRG